MKDIIMVNVPVQMSVVVSELVQRLNSKDTLELIKNIDLSIGDCGFTESIIHMLLDSLASDVPDRKAYDRWKAKAKLELGKFLEDL